MTHRYVWGPRFRVRDLPVLDRKGQACRILVRGAMNSALVEFEDGYQAVISRNALRRIRPREWRPSMTHEQRSLARHALGLGHKYKESYRNRFVTGEGSTDHPHWMAMVAAGWAKRWDGKTLEFGGDDFFRLTPEGAALALNPGEFLDPEDFPQAVPQESGGVK